MREYTVWYILSREEGFALRTRVLAQTDSEAFEKALQGRLYGTERIALDCPDTILVVDCD